MNKVPSLTQLREFIREHHLDGWWNRWPSGRGSIGNFFQGNCHYASRALAKFLDADRWSVTRGWYTRTEALDRDKTWIKNSHGHIAHTWVEIGDKIIDPTWWAFHPEERVKIYTFTPRSANYYHYHTVDPR